MKFSCPNVDEIEPQSFALWRADIERTISNIFDEMEQRNIKYCEFTLNLRDEVKLRE